jgi:hypothetical protein
MEDKKSPYDFTDEILHNQNEEVDELCGCPGKEKTRSNRVLKEHHESWCFYYMHVEDKMKKMLKDRFDA